MPMSETQTDNIYASFTFTMRNMRFVFVNTVCVYGSVAVVCKRKKLPTLLMRLHLVNRDLYSVEIYTDDEYWF